MVFNKWDLIADKDTNTHLEHWEEFCRDVPFLPYAPWFTISAETAPAHRQDHGEGLGGPRGPAEADPHQRS